MIAMMTKPPALTIWLTGLPSSGKTTLGRRVVSRLWATDSPAVLLDGDDLRRHVSADLSYTAEDRASQAERTSGIAHLLNRSGVCAVVALVSPSCAVRERARSQVPRFFEVYVDCPVSVCQERDRKGNYRRALAGEILEFTGVSADYEAPLQPEVRVCTDLLTPESAVDLIFEGLRQWETENV